MVYIKLLFEVKNLEGNKEIVGKAKGAVLIGMGGNKGFDN